MKGMFFKLPSHYSFWHVLRIMDLNSYGNAVYFDQQMVCWTPVCWSKYTTCKRCELQLMFSEDIKLSRIASHSFKQFDLVGSSIEESDVTIRFENPNCLGLFWMGTCCPIQRTLSVPGTITSTWLFKRLAR